MTIMDNFKKKCRLNRQFSLVLRCKRTPQEVGVNLKQGYNGDLTSKQAGSVGGQMVKKMIKAYEESMK